MFRPPFPGVEYVMNTNVGLIGKKLGTTQIFDEDGNVHRVTAIAAGPCVIVGKRTAEVDGYTALQLGFGSRKAKKVNKALAGFYAKNGADPAEKVEEFRIPADSMDQYEVGQELKAADLFTAGQFVDVTGTSKGRGFTGVMKRHNFSGAGTVGHGTHEAKRHGGSIGMNMTPGRTLPGQKMPGQHGNKRVTMLNLKVARVLEEENLVLVDGSVPGPKHGMIAIRSAVKKSQKSA